MRASLDNRGDSVLSTERWRERIAPEKVVYAQDQRSFTTPVRPGSPAGPDFQQLLDRQATVHRYLERAAAVGLSWPLPDDCDDQRLNELLFPARPIWPPVSCGRPPTSRRFIPNSRRTGILRCSSCGRSTARLIRTVMAIADSASYTSGGIRIQDVSAAGRSTGPARKSSWTGQVRHHTDL